MERGAACLLCRGTKMLCGLPYCPVLARSLAASRLASLSGRVVEGCTPPSVYVSWRGYPRVSAGPATPPVVGDTRLYEAPEDWLDVGMNRFLEMRLSLVTGLLRIDARKPPEILQELALSSEPVHVEMRLERVLRPVPTLDPCAPPSGPRGSLERMKILSNPKAERPVEKAYHDLDMPVEEAVVYLYEAGVPVSKIQQLLSVGALGTGRRRRLVPTRWAITAVDDIVSRHLVSRVRDLPELDEYLFFERRYAGNLFAAVVAPGPWGYEWIEAWYPGTVWNRGSEVEVEGDWEAYKGRTTYASLGGCYYAARLATAEFMLRRGRQGTAVLVREIYEGFDIPVGVWFVRENVRRMFESEPERLSSLDEALRRLDEATRLPLREWLRASKILRTLLKQRRLLEGGPWW